MAVKVAAKIAGGLVITSVFMQFPGLYFVYGKRKGLGINAADMVLADVYPEVNAIGPVPDD
jgi:hypothetical protein